MVRQPGRKGGGNGILVGAGIVTALIFLGIIAYSISHPAPIIFPTVPPVVTTPPQGGVIAVSPTKLVLWERKYASGSATTEIADSKVKISAWGFDPTKLYPGDSCSSCYSWRDNLQTNIKNSRWLSGSVTGTYDSGHGGYAAWTDDATIANQTAAKSSSLMVGWINSGQVTKDPADGKYRIWVSLVDYRVPASQEYFYEVIQLKEGTDFFLQGIDITNLTWVVKNVEGSNIGLAKIGSVTATCATDADSLDWTLTFVTSNGDLINPFTATDTGVYQGGLRGFVDFAGSATWDGSVATWNSDSLGSFGFVPGSSADMWFDLPDLRSGAVLSIGWSGSYSASTALTLYTEPELGYTGSPVQANTGANWYSSYYTASTVVKAVLSASASG